MLTHHCGIPKRKLTVPSSGSTTQRRPLVPGRSSPSSPMIASSGRAASSRARISRSVATSASETRSVGVLLALIASSPSRPNASRSAGAGLVRDRGGELDHAASGGRRSGQPIAVSSWAESESSVASSSGRPTSWTATGTPAGADLDRHRGGGLAGVVPERQVGREVRHPVQHDRGRQPEPLADRRRQARQRRREQHVVVGEHGADPLAVGAPPAPARARPGSAGSARPGRRGRGSSGRAAPDAASRPRRSGSRAGSG